MNFDFLAGIFGVFVTLLITMYSIGVVSILVAATCSFIALYNGHIELLIKLWVILFIEVCIIPFLNTFITRNMIAAISNMNLLMIIAILICLLDIIFFMYLNYKVYKYMKK